MTAEEIYKVKRRFWKKYNNATDGALARMPKFMDTWGPEMEAIDMLEQTISEQKAEIQRLRASLGKLFPAIDKVLLIPNHVMNARHDLECAFHEERWALEEAGGE